MRNTITSCFILEIHTAQATEDSKHGCRSPAIQPIRAIPDSSNVVAEKQENHRDVRVSGRRDSSFRTLVKSKGAEELGVIDDVHPLCLQWTRGIEREKDESQLIKLRIAGAAHDMT